MRPHKKSIRGLQFTSDGTGLFSASSDKSVNLIDLNRGELTWHKPKAHESSINAMLLFDKNLFTGDDDGGVQVWDWRQQSSVMNFTENEDFISDFARYDHLLLSPSGDGTLSIFDLRKGILEAMSDNMEDELLSIAVMKNGQKVVCGSQGGVLNIFKYGYWGDVNDRYPGHPESIDTIQKVSENVLVTGSSDGLIRLVQILPNKILGVLGGHNEYPIERIKMSKNGNLLASCSHDNTVKFWDVKFISGGNLTVEMDNNDITVIDHSEDGSDDNDGIDYNNGTNEGSSIKNTLKKQKRKGKKSFFSDL